MRAKAKINMCQNLVFILSCSIFSLEKVRRGLGDAARDLANSLLQNVVDTYRKENESICAAFEEIERIALNAPKSTKEMIELGEYMLHVKNKRMLQLNVSMIQIFRVFKHSSLCKLPQYSDLHVGLIPRLPLLTNFLE